MLGEGEGQRPVPRERLERRHRWAVGTHRRLDATGELRHGGGLEEVPQRQFQPEGGRHSGHHLGRQQRVPAQVEEAVVDPDPLHDEHLGPDPGQQFLDGVARRGVNGLAPILRRRQGPAIDLAVRGQRQGVESHPSRRLHVLRQVFREVRTQLGDAGLPHRVGHQTPLPREILTGHDHGFPHPGVANEHRLDLPQLDAEPTDLHLVIGATQEVQLASLEVTHRIPRAVEAASRLGAPRIGYEGSSSLRRPPQIPSRQPDTRDAEFPPTAEGNRCQLAVDDIEPEVRERPADRRSARSLGFHHGRGGDDTRLGGPICVEQDERQVGWWTPAQPVPAGHQEAQGGLRWPIEIQGDLGQRSGQEGVGDPLRHQPVSHRRGVGADLRSGQGDPCPGRQIRPEFPDNCIESEPCQLGAPIVAGHLPRLLEPIDQIAQGAVADRDTLRPAGGAGSVDDVGGMVWQDMRRGGFYSALARSLPFCNLPPFFNTPTFRPADIHRHGALRFQTAEPISVAHPHHRRTIAENTVEAACGK